MRIDEVELRVVALPLVTPFAAAHGSVTVRTAVLVHLIGMLGTQLFWGANPRAPIGG